jgi:hypothetical protein
MIKTFQLRDSLYSDEIIKLLKLFNEPYYTGRGSFMKNCRDLKDELNSILYKGRVSYSAIKRFITQPPKSKPNQNIKLYSKPKFENEFQSFKEGSFKASEIIELMKMFKPSPHMRTSGDLFKFLNINRYQGPLTFSSIKRFLSTFQKKK